MLEKFRLKLGSLALGKLQEAVNEELLYSCSKEQTELIERVINDRFKVKIFNDEQYKTYILNLILVIIRMFSGGLFGTVIQVLPTDVLKAINAILRLKAIKIVFKSCLMAFNL